jgi:predicted porin
MKKTLIALAAVAATGAAFAQSSVTLSGKLRFAYEATKATSAAGVATKANGIGVTDGDFVLTANEDLGGGMKAIASMAVKSRGRDTGIEGRDAYLALAGGFGTVTIGAVEAGNGIIGLGGAGAPVYGMDGSVIAAAANVDILKYTSPSFSGLQIGVALTDKTAALGMGAQEASTETATLGAQYANGPIAAYLDTTKYSRNAVPASAGVPDLRVRLAGSYDLGVVKLGAGFERKTYLAGGPTRKDMIFGVSAPVASNITLGLNYATSKTNGATAKGLDLGAQYDLSKRTYVAMHFEDVKNVGYVDGAKNQKYRIQLSHAF